MDNIQIGRLIYEKRKELGLTQQELADRLQITNKAVSKWENGDGMPDVNLLAPLAAELGLTVDELLNGEEKAPCTEPDTDKNETKICESPLIAGSSAVEAKDAVIGIIACAVSVGYALTGFSQIFQYCMIYADRLPSLLPSIAFSVYNIVFWALISAVFICKLLRIHDIDTPNIKSITIAAFVIGLPMIYIQQFDTSILSYGCFFFILALLLSECHGYRTPHKIFYGLAILATVCFGLINLFDSVDAFSLSDLVDRTQFFGFLSRLFRALLFYILYGAFEKCCDGYERKICIFA